MGEDGLEGLTTAIERGARSAGRFGLELPILMAPMAGSCPPAAGLRRLPMREAWAAVGALLMQGPRRWLHGPSGFVGASPNGAFQMNLWNPDPRPSVDPEREATVRQFLAGWGSEPRAGRRHLPVPEFPQPSAGQIAELRRR